MWNYSRFNLVQKCVALSAVGKTFSITDTKFYVLPITLSTEDNIKPLTKLESGFKRTSNWNEY